MRIARAIRFLPSLQVSLLTSRVLLGLAVLPSLSANAGEAEDLSRALQKIAQTSSRAEPSCPKSAPKNGRVTIVFEGTKGYCPKRALTELPLWNEVESLEEKFIALIERSSNEGQEWKGIQALGKQYDLAIRGEGGFAHACYLQGALKNVMDQTRGFHRARERAPNLIYYSKGGSAEAAKCISSLSAKASSPLALSIIGYSMGGAAAVEFVKLVESGPHRIEQVITIDPVGKDGRWVDGVLRTRDNPKLRRSPSVGRWLNYYQKQDFRALSKGILVDVGIRGSSVIDADLNREFGARYFSGWRFWETPHSLILYLLEVQESLSRLVWRF